MNPEKFHNNTENKELILKKIEKLTETLSDFLDEEVVLTHSPYGVDTPIETSGPGTYGISTFEDGKAIIDSSLIDDSEKIELFTNVYKNYLSKTTTNERQYSEAAIDPANNAVTEETRKVAKFKLSDFLEEMKEFA